MTEKERWILSSVKNLRFVVEIYGRYTDTITRRGI
jgi:hypothetical protein